jgi:hypothetical protein
VLLELADAEELGAQQLLIGGGSAPLPLPLPLPFGACASRSARSTVAQRRSHTSICPWLTRSHKVTVSNADRYRDLALRGASAETRATHATELR